MQIAQRDEGPATTNALAERLGVTAASASGMCKRLGELGLVDHVPYKGVELTADGERVALEVIRHHRLLELYLAESLDVPWDRVHAEAEVLEHVLSEELEALIAAKLGNPTVDPHGDPIPTADLVMEERPTSALADLAAGRARHLRAHLRLRSGDAALPGRAGHRARRRLRGHRQAAVRRPHLRSLRRRRPRARRGARARHAGPGGGVTDAAVSLPSPSRLQQLQSRGRLRGTFALLGPAFVACIAYVDPGNFATNIAGGAKYGYLLLWVLLSANLMAMLIQNLSAKIGLATGRNLPELCRDHFPRPVSWGLWVQAELIAMATDLAEFVGAAIALNLLFGVPLFPAGIITAIVAFGILALQAKGYRRFEAVIAGLLG